MTAAASRAGSPARLAALQRTALLDSPAEEAFDRLTRLAARVLRVPVALVVLVDADRQFFKSQVGLPEPWASRRETPLSHSFCRHQVDSGDILVIDDARRHPLVRDNLAIRDLGAVAYAGVPLVTSDGQPLGSFCVIDHRPRHWTAEEVAILEELTASAVTEIELQGALREAARQLTQREQAQEALRQSEARFRTIWEFAVDAMALSDPAGVVLMVNPAYCELYGYAEEALVGEDFAIIFPEEERAWAREQYRSVFRSAAPPPAFETTIQRADGAKRIVESRIDFLTEHGRRTAMLSVIRDVTDRRRAEAEQALARRAMEALAREREAVLAQTADGVIVADAQGRLTFVNEAARRLHGVAALGVPVERYAEAYHLFTLDGQPYPPEELPLARAVRRGETVVDATWRIRRPDGTEIVAQGSAAPVTAEDGTRLASVLVMRDVTAQHDLERQKEEFLAAVAHDLKNPLVSIRGFAQLLRRQMARGQTPPPERVAEALGTIETTATRMAAQLDELLDVTGLQMQRSLELEHRPTDLVALARQAAAEHQHATERHRIVVEAAVSALVGLWDADRLRRVVDNLLGNALKYSPHGGDVVVTVAREQRAPHAGDAPGAGGGPGAGWAVLQVRDYGMGIPAADLPHVFERFRRSGSVIGKIAGTGVGLAAARQIVEQHGGTIAVESVEGRGSTFTVRLPLADAAEASRPSA